ncbi:MAG: ATP-dependent helicase, partial [Halanaerobiales bacterium]
MIFLQQNDIIENLNEEQKKAVCHKEGPLLVLAGAGSGKTRVLTRRVAYLIKEYGVWPRNILGVTFTNKAADEMKERVAVLLNDLPAEPWISTFHSLCVQILAREIEKLGYKKNYVIFDSSDQKKLMKNVLSEMNIDIKKTKPRAVLHEIGQAKNELIDPDDYKKNEVNNYFSELVSKIYPVYQQKLKENNALDFDDLIMKTVYLFAEYPAVLEYYQQQFKYILIDEYQDVNFAQYQMVQLLARKHRNLCVVGDPDQGIYGFRGADIRNIMNFEDDYPESRVIKLEQNYRSKETILKAAQKVIQNNEFRKEKELWTAKGKGDKINYYVASSEKDEAHYICKKIKELKNKKYNYSDFAVLYRTNAQSRPLEEMMIKFGIPYQIVGGHRFYDRMEIRDILG